MRFPCPSRVRTAACGLALASVAAASPQAVGGGAAAAQVPPQAIFVRAQWGNLAHSSTAPAPRNWQGFLAGTRGHVDVLTFLAAEPSDHPLPSVAPNVAQWASVTGGHTDGLIAAWKLGGLPIDLPTYATFFTPPFSTTLTPAALGQLNQLHTVDLSGNMISLVGLAAHPGQAAGFGSGHWSAGVPGSAGGSFGGPWTEPNGSPLGLLHGHWLAGDHPGQGSLVGVVVHPNQQPLAVLQGEFHAHPEGPGGVLHGLWLDPETGHPLAGFRGNYASALDAGGFFQIAWTSPGN